jgi:nucleoid-associated protein YgaU
MVTMETRRSMVAVTGEHAHPARGQIRTERTRRPATPVRLTRRGRVVVTGVSALIIGLASVALATTAQATRGGGATAAASPGRYVTRVMVRSGQNLWTLAEGYDPDADTRLVIADIVQMNSLTTDQLQPGERLWVPRG